MGCGPGKAYDSTKSGDECAGAACTVGECCKDCATQKVAPFTTTTTDAATVGTTSLVLAAVTDIAVGMAVSGDSGLLATNTRVVAVDEGSKTVTLSKPTAAPVLDGATVTFEGAACASEHAGACVTSLAATAADADIDTTELRCLVPHAGYFVDATGTAQPYFSTCGNTDGYGKLFTDEACGPGQIYDGAKFANSCEGTTCDDSTDAARCCKPATCGNTGDGSPFTDQDCGAGYLYDTAKADEPCTGASCQVQVTCCTDEQNSCDGTEQVRIENERNL